MPRFLPFRVHHAAALLLVLGTSVSCATIDESTVHNMNAVSLRASVYDEVDWERTFEGFVNRFDFPAELSGVGLQYESFITGDLSVTVGVERRHYAIDLKGADEGDGNEVWLGGRYYLNSDGRLQPFGAIAVGVSPGLEFKGGIESDAYLAGRFGVGTAWFIDDAFALEALVAYEVATFDTTLSLTNNLVVEDKIDGVMASIGLSFLF